MTRKVKCKDGAAVVIGVAQGTMSIDDEDVEDDEDDKESHPIIFNTSFRARRARGEFVSTPKEGDELVVVRHHEPRVN